MQCRICTKCKKEKPVKDFSERKFVKKNGYNSHCKQCHNEYQNTPAKKKVARNRMLLRCYNMTLEDYDQMLDKQKGVCAICGESETRRLHGVIARLSVDHDHKTGKVRGLLCTNCNVGLGYLDNKLWFSSAKQYLKKVKYAKRHRKK